MKWRVPRIWEGGTCVIIGGGPSITKQFDIPEEIVQKVCSGELQPNAYSPFLEPIHKLHVIGVNVAYRMGDWVDVMYFGDESTWNEEKYILQNYYGLKVTCCPELQNLKSVKYIARNPKVVEGIHRDDPETVCWNQNSGGSAINLAYHFGVKRIILLGFDMNVGQNKNQHWHKIYPQYKDATQPSERILSFTFRRHRSSFSAIKQHADELGIEIINANPDSALDQFVKMNFKEINL